MFPDFSGIADVGEKLAAQFEEFISLLRQIEINTRKTGISNSQYNPNPDMNRITCGAHTTNFEDQNHG